MPEVQVIFFRRTDGKVPIKDWLHHLMQKDRRKSLERIERLREQGHALDRPFAAYLQDGIYELRVKSGNVHFRMLYFFHAGSAVVVTHGLIKKTDKIPTIEIERAAERKRDFLKFPATHAFPWEP